MVQPLLNLVYVGMNTKHPVLANPLVRQAINYAVDVDTIVDEITRRGSLKARGVLPPGIAGHDPKFDMYQYDPDKAKKLLEQAGYPGGEGIEPLEIWTVSKSESVQKELHAYTRYLGNVGLKIIPRVAASWKEFVGLIREKKAPLFYLAWYADYPDPDNFLYPLFFSTSRTNRMGYNNPEVDERLRQARRETDYMRRVELYQEIQRMVLADAPIVYQHVNSFSYLFQPWVKGVETNYLGAAYIPFRKVWLEREAAQ